MLSYTTHKQPTKADNKVPKINISPHKRSPKLQFEHDVYMTSLGYHSRSNGGSIASIVCSASTAVGLTSDTKQKSIRHDGLAAE